MNDSPRKPSEEMKLFVLERDNYMCRYCGSKRKPLHLDHVYPYSKGGETSVENLVTSCEACNKHKNNKVGIFPKPVGYFDKTDKRIYAIYPLLFLLFGVFLLTNSFLYFNKSVVMGVGGIVFVFGSMAILMSNKLK